MSARRLALACCLAVALDAPALRAQGELDHYDPQSTSWKGMSSFKGLAEGMGFEVLPVGTLQWEDLSAEDILVLVYPLQRVDPSKLGAFIQAGGYAIIADDFGEAKDAMQSLGLLRAEVTTPRATKFQNNQPWAPIAMARGDHPIALDVGEVVTNHPASLSNVVGATIVVSFDEGAVVVAGERGTGRFVAVSDPSIFINRMQQFRGNVQLAHNMLRWLDRNGRAKRVILLRGDVQMYGDPPPFIDDANAGKVGRSVAELNHWLWLRSLWLLTPTAMKVLGAVLAVLLLVLALLALPVRRGPKIDGAWLRFGRPGRRDEPHALVTAADGGGASSLVLACILRDQVQVLLASITNKLEPLYTVPEPQLVSDLARARGPAAGAALSKVYRRLRSLPSRGQAAAPWSAGHLARRDFDALYTDVAELCRTLGAPLPDDSELPSAGSVSIPPGRHFGTRPPVMQNPTALAAPPSPIPNPNAPGSSSSSPPSSSPPRA